MAARTPLDASVRPERPDDRAAVYRINESAFGRADEARLVERLRTRARPLLSLVAESGGAMAGHILFTPVTLEGFTGLLLGLAPMAVAPDRQRRGIGSALVRAGLERCRDLEVGAVVVLGHPDYYPKFGFVPAARFALRCEYDAPAEAFTALELRPGALAGASGTVRYHPAFAEL
jgi:putative acetyltransferase